MLPLIWQPEAGEDWRTILDFISDQSPQGARTLQALLTQSLERVSVYPHLYREGRVAGTREALFHPNYFYVYRVQSKCIEILSVIHARREYPPS
jgi:plasmid stabilization system protein ParE